MVRYTDNSLASLGSPLQVHQVVHTHTSSAEKKELKPYKLTRKNCLKMIPSYTSTCKIV